MSKRTRSASQQNPLDDLIVAIPMGELGYQRFWQYLLVNPDFGYLVQQKRVITISGGYTHGSPNQLVKDALSKDAPPWKRFLSLEHDHIFPLDVFQRHACYTEDAVAGLYVMRDIDNPLPVIYNWDSARANALLPPADVVNKMLVERGMYQVDCVPMGCTSIRRDVLEQWPKDQPWFSSYTNAHGNVISHDIWFCRVAQDHGRQAWVDTSLKVLHICQIPIDDSFFTAWWNAKGSKQAAEELRQKQEAMEEKQEWYEPMEEAVC